MASYNAEFISIIWQEITICRLKMEFYKTFKFTTMILTEKQFPNSKNRITGKYRDVYINS